MSVLRWHVVLVAGLIISSGRVSGAETGVSLGCKAVGTTTSVSCAVLADQLILGSASQPGVIGTLATRVRDFYDGRVDLNHRMTKSGVPVCSLKRGPIQKYMLQQLSLPATETVEDLRNHRGQSCGDLHQFKVEQGPKGLKYDLLFASKNPVQAPGQGPYFGYWERSHMDSVYVLALEEALLEVRKELSSSTGTWRPRTVSGADAWRRASKTTDRVGTLRGVILAEVDQRARFKVAASRMFRADANDFHKIFDSAGMACVALVESKLKLGQAKGASGIQQVVNRDCMPKAKTVLQAYASKYFPLLFAQK